MIMKIRDFEQAMPQAVTIDSFKCKKGEVVWCLCHRQKDELPVVYDKKGHAYCHDKEERNLIPFLCLVHGGYTVLKGLPFNDRIPELDLDFK